MSAISKLSLIITTAQLLAITINLLPISAQAQTENEKAGIDLSNISKLTKVQAGWDRLKVGDIEVVALSDGSAALDVTKGIALNAQPDEIRALLKNNCDDSPIDCSINAFLIRLADKWILIDTGASELIGPTAGKLTQSLHSLGVKPEEISDIFITHIHPDHSGGLMDGDKKVFPNATVHINKKEVDYWFDPKQRALAGEPQKTFFPQAELKVKPYIDAGQVKTFEDEKEFFPGLRSQPAYGHTPGHTFYVLESNNQKIVFWGDMIHIPSAQFDKPSIAMRFDSDSTKAVSVRQKAFADAAEKGYLAAGDHLPFPGIGHVRKEGEHYRWYPVNYLNDAKTNR